VSAWLDRHLGVCLIAPAVVMLATFTFYPVVARSG